uniref:Uncharacterized protein n=1 Tax=Nicotiana tabacum TaxID=4097 RepID=A0A1S3Y8D8_TOBAC|nr:PREDICTED: uncharacterized protein LOC107773494 [Nicotiana tabacum]
MKGTSKIKMAAVLIIVVSLAMVLGLVLVLLAEFFCSLLLLRRQRSKTTINSTSASIAQPPPPRHQDQSIAPILSSFYAQGVLHAPRNFLFPKDSLSSVIPQVQSGAYTDLNPKKNFDFEMQNRNSSPPYPSFVQIQSPKLVHEVPLQCSTSTCTTMEQFVYISNPIYDNEKLRPSMVDTPFETPNSSPSYLETIDNSSEKDDENYGISSSSSTSPSSSVQLTPMKKLPAEACSVSLRDVRSIVISGSDSNSNNSSSSSGSPCTSPSW